MPMSGMDVRAAPTGTVSGSCSAALSSSPPTRSSACRCLFGRPTDEDRAAMASEYRRLIDEHPDQKSTEYNFNFRLDKPQAPSTTDRYEWMPTWQVDTLQEDRSRQIDPDSIQPATSTASNADQMTEDRPRDEDSDRRDSGIVVTPPSAITQSSPAENNIVVTAVQSSSSSTSSPDDAILSTPTTTASSCRKRRREMTGL